MLAEGSFLTGLSNFMRHSAVIAKDYFDNTITLNASEVNDYFTSIAVMSAYMIDAINIYST